MAAAALPSTLDALAFGPGLPAAGARATLALTGEGTGTVVELRVGELVRRADVAAVRLREVGFGKPGIELAWSADGEDWAVHVLDHAVAQGLLQSRALAGTQQAQTLVAGRRRRGAGRALGWSAVAFFVLLPAILLVAFVLQSDRIAEWVVERIPVEQEREFGRTSFESLRRELQLEDTGATYEAVQTIGRRLTAGSKYQYEFHVARDPAINAFALPGGIVVVNTGLVAATKRPEELAGVLAHEVQHVEQRHSLEAMAKQLGLRAVWTLFTGDVSGVATEAALQLGSLTFSRDAEREADAKGFALLVARGIDPSGMPAFFETLQREEGGAEPPALLSTHPASTARAEALARELQSLGARKFEPLELGSWPPQ